MHDPNNGHETKSSYLSKRLPWHKNHQCGCLSLIAYYRYHLNSPNRLIDLRQTGVLLLHLCWLGFTINIYLDFLLQISTSTGAKWDTLLYRAYSLNNWSIDATFYLIIFYIQLWQWAHRFCRLGQNSSTPHHHLNVGTRLGHHFHGDG